jgi:hypothetical protein
MDSGKTLLTLVACKDILTMPESIVIVEREREREREKERKL